ncbi:MAG: AAA family ATPase [Acidiphilium sp.]|nr:AAA family ATPase [Acidiphilium sp.]
MKIVTMLSQKGGTGKTTLALHLAAAAELAGYTALVIDLDKQGSATDWKEERTAERPIVVPGIAKRLKKALASAAEQGIEIALIDTAAQTSDDAMLAIDEADVVLIPTRPLIFDLRAITTNVRMVRLADKPAYVVFNQVRVGAVRLIEEVVGSVEETGVKVCPVAIEHRAAIAHALTADLVVQEYDPESPAAQQMADLFGWLVTALDGIRAPATAGAA